MFVAVFQSSFHGGNWVTFEMFTVEAILYVVNNDFSIGTWRQQIFAFSSVEINAVNTGFMDLFYLATLTQFYGSYSFTSFIFRNKVG